MCNSGDANAWSTQGPSVQRCTIAIWHGASLLHWLLSVLCALACSHVCPLEATDGKHFLKLPFIFHKRRYKTVSRRFSLPEPSGTPLWQLLDHYYPRTPPPTSSLTKYENLSCLVVAFELETIIHITPSVIWVQVWVITIFLDCFQKLSFKVGALSY